MKIHSTQKNLYSVLAVNLCELPEIWMRQLKPSLGNFVGFLQLNCEAFLVSNSGLITMSHKTTSYLQDNGYLWKGRWVGPGKKKMECQPYLKYFLKNTYDKCLVMKYS